MLRKSTFFLILLVFLIPTALFAQKITTSHGIALFGDLMYGPDFKHFNYVNPDAPKGGTIVWDINAFDSINPYITLGTSPGFASFSVFENLMIRCGDEPGTSYGLIAETISYPDDYKWVEYKLRDIARWNDGKPITVDDVIFSYETMRDKASPTFQNVVVDIEKVEKTGADKVRFSFKKAGLRTNVVKMGLGLPVIPKHYWEKRDFSQPTTVMEVQSTPYVFHKVDVGNTLVMKRDEKYWGKDLPVNVGRNNFDFVRMDVYRDSNVTYEAFMAGNIDIRNEGVPAKWKKGYNNNAVKNGLIKLREDKMKGSVWFFGIGMNGRRHQFKDQKTREALAHAFDWEWTNKNIYYGMYERNRSYFSNTELAHNGIPEGKELALLEPYRDQLDPRVFTREFVPPSTDGTQAGLRKNLRIASQLLKEAGWKNIDGKLVRDGKPFTVDFMLQDSSDEPIFAPFVENLKLLGIDARLEIVDSTTFWPRTFSYDWDMLSNGLYPHSLSPGTAIRQNWSSDAADVPMSSNTQYIKNPVVDDLIEKVINAKTREDKVAACRALDRVLLWNYYSINLYVGNIQMMAYWDRFGIPEIHPKWEAFSPSDTWWIDPQKTAVVEKHRSPRLGYKD